MKFHFQRERDRERLRERIRETEWSVGFIFCTGYMYQINFVKNIAIGTSHYSFKMYGLTSDLASLSVSLSNKS